jgi:hypothetical protein
MNFCTFELQTLVPQPPDLEELSKEERIKEALQAITSPQKLSLRRAAAAYNVPETTLRRRRCFVIAFKNIRVPHLLLWLRWLTSLERALR